MITARLNDIYLFTLDKRRCSPSNGVHSRTGTRIALYIYVPFEQKRHKKSNTIKICRKNII